jgi:hypothetical protein
MTAIAWREWSDQMAGGATFDSTKTFLKGLLEGVNGGTIQLPDFQRDWIWDDEHVRSLLASISLTYPIGTVMLLQTGNADVHFKPRLLEGVTLTTSPEPAQLILDGQQRLTSLFLALFSGKPVPTRDTRGRDMRRWYYIDMAKALDPQADRDDAIISLPEDRKLKNFRGEVIADYSSPDGEYQAGYFPFGAVFDSAKWRNGYNKWCNYDPERLMRFDDFEDQCISAFRQYLVPVIVLGKDTPKEAVCQVFEKVNTGGVALSVFELLTAMYAADNFKLRDDWKLREQRLRHHKILQGLQNTFFLQALTLIATYTRKRAQPEMAVSCKRKDVLRLSLADYQQWAEPITTGFERAAQFLFEQNIFDARDVPYTSQLVPLAAMFVVLGDRANMHEVRARMARWYWCGVFGELYGGATETRFAKDLPDLIDWVNGGGEPTTVIDANFQPVRLLTMRTRNSAAYKGVSALLMKEGARDFRSGISIGAHLYTDDAIDIHHIFPRVWCSGHEVDSAHIVW